MDLSKISVGHKKLHKLVYIYIIVYYMARYRLCELMLIMMASYTGYVN